MVGPLFCSENYLLLKKLNLIRMDNTEQQIKRITRSPEQYKNIQREGNSED